MPGGLFVEALMHLCAGLATDQATVRLDTTAHIR